MGFSRTVRFVATPDPDSARPLSNLNVEGAAPVVRHMGSGSRPADPYTCADVCLHLPTFLLDGDASISKAEAPTRLHYRVSGCATMFAMTEARRLYTRNSPQYARRCNLGNGVLATLRLAEAQGSQNPQMR